MKNEIAEMWSSINLFDLYEGINAESYEEGNWGTDLQLSVAPEDLSAYLFREEKFTNLQREHYKRELCKFQISEVEEKIFSFVPAQNDGFRDIVSRISRTLTRPLLKNLKEDTDEYADAIRALSVTENLSISLEWVSGTVPELDSARNRVKDSGALILGIRIDEVGYKPYIVYGLKDYSHSGVDKNALYKTGTLVGDLADLLSCIVLHQQVNKFIETLAEEGQGNPLYEPYCRACFDYTVKLYNQLMVYPPEQEGYYKENMEEKWKLPLFFSSTVPLTPHMQRLKEEDIISILSQVTQSEIDSVTGGKPCIRMGGHSSRYIEFCHLMKHPVPYNELNSSSEKRNMYWGLPNCFGSSTRCRFEEIYLSLYATLFRLLAEEKNAQISTCNYYKELHSDYAKSFMLKKNIPPKILESMRSSRFNKYFGFVEYDEETDIVRAGEVAMEFSALWEAYLQKIDSTKNILRFRKLGQHKAFGLYYPAFGCLCVDLRHTTSLVHEYGHLIDFTHQCLSTKSDFYHIRTAYKAALESAVENNTSLKGSLKGKYNLAYFLLPTEIFARCFELYVSQILHVKNSLVPEEFKEGIYPQHEDFLRMIKVYFDNLLSVENENNRVSELEKVVNTTRW